MTKKILTWHICNLPNFLEYILFGHFLLPSFLPPPLPTPHNHTKLVQEMQLFSLELSFQCFTQKVRGQIHSQNFLGGKVAQLRAANTHCSAFKLESSFSLSALLFLVLSWWLLQVKASQHLHAEVSSLEEEGWKKGNLATKVVKH